MIEHQLDVRNLLCPLPVIRTQELVETLAAGDAVSIICSDPGALNDIPAWCRIHGHKLLATEQVQGHIIVKLLVQNEARK